MNKRELRLENFGITSKRYKELCGFCEQYPEWKAFLATNENAVKSKKIDGVSHSTTNSKNDETADLAIKRTVLQNKVDMIESIAKEVDPGLWECIIKSVCYECPFWYIRDILNLPVSRTSFYAKRRYFFYLLDQEKKKRGT